MSYRWKLFLSITVIAAIALIAAGLGLLVHFEEILQDRVLLRINGVGEMASRAVQEYLEQEEPDSVRTLLVDLAGQQSVGIASLIDRDGKVLFSSNADLEGQLTPLEESEHYGVPDTSVYVKSFTVFSGTTLHGYLQIAYSMSRYRQDLRELGYWFTAYEVIIMVIIFGSALLITAHLLSPLENMYAAAIRIASGDFSAVVPAGSKDVIGRLGGAFNEMSARLQDLTLNLCRKVNDAVAEYENANRELQKANEKLRELDGLKSQFVSFVSHELRSPLSGIIGMTRMLQRSGICEEDRMRFLRMLEEEERRMAAIIEEFLDLSRIETGTIRYDMKPVDPASLIEETLQVFPVPETVGIVFDYDPDLPEILADRDRIKQVVGNVLGNAVKYSPEGGKIRIRLLDRRTHVVIRISDDGIGVRPEDRDRIFELYGRGGDDITTKLRGSGIGLGISKAIVEAHGGTIGVETGSTGGADFFVELPCSGALPPNRVPSEEPPYREYIRTLDGGMI